MSYKFKAWVQASRPASNVNIIFPLVLGTILGANHSGYLNIPILIMILFYGWFDQMFIVFWNDFADAEADQINKDFTFYSGGSRVIPQKKLRKETLFMAGAINAALVLSSGIILTFIFKLNWILPLFFFGLFLLWAYSFSPLRLNYRGGGEILQTIGCSVLLPLIGFYSQTNVLFSFEFIYLIPFALLHFANAVAATIPDAKADRIAGKNTISAIFGETIGVKICGLCLILAGIVQLSYISSGHYEDQLIYILTLMLFFLGGTTITLNRNTTKKTFIKTNLVVSACTVFFVIQIGIAAMLK